MTLTYKPAVDLSLPDLAALFTHAFTGYIGGTVNMTAPLLAGMIAQNGINLNLSTLAYRDETPVGFGLIARQGWTSRLAAMGIAPEAQGQQVGYHLMTDLIEQARLRGDRHIELEVFEQNVRAVKLYEKTGFRILRRLIGCTLSQPQGDPSPDLTEIDIFDAARLIMAHSPADLAWQVSASHLIRLGSPDRAYRLGEAVAIISSPANETVAIRAINVPPDHRQRGYGSRLLSALWGAHPAKHWIIQPICPEEFLGFFEKNGFTRMELNQYQMRLDLAT